MKAGVATPTATSITNLQNFSSHLHHFGVCWFGVLGTQGSNVFTGEAQQLFR